MERSVTSTRTAPRTRLHDWWGGSVGRLAGAMDRDAAVEDHLERPPRHNEDVHQFVPTLKQLVDVADDRMSSWPPRQHRFQPEEVTDS